MGWSFSGQNLTVSDSKRTSFNGVFSRLGCYLKSSSGLSGINKAGTIFFGITPNYLAEVQKKEIFELVGHGFDYNSLKQMSIEERRYYYHLLLKKREPNDGTSPQNNPKKNEKVKFSPVG